MRSKIHCKIPSVYHQTHDGVAYLDLANGLILIPFLADEGETDVVKWGMLEDGLRAKIEDNPYDIEYDISAGQLVAKGTVQVKEEAHWVHTDSMRHCALDQEPQSGKYISKKGRYYSTDLLQTG
eukprot:3618182-Ditylum_brightwellii.AAC.1